MFGALKRQKTEATKNVSFPNHLLFDVQERTVQTHVFVINSHIPTNCVLFFSRTIPLQVSKMSATTAVQIYGVPPQILLQSCFDRQWQATGMVDSNTGCKKVQGLDENFAPLHGRGRQDVFKCPQLACMVNRLHCSTVTSSVSRIAHKKKFPFFRA